MTIKERSFKEKVERRVIKDRRKQRFGRSRPKILIKIANWLTSNPNAFICYMIISMVALLYSVANLAYNLDALIIEVFKELIK